MERFRQISKNHAALLAFLILLATTALSFHAHRAEAKLSDHCASCHIRQQVSSVDLPATPVLEAPSAYLESALVLVSNSFVSSPLLIGKLSQAPPIS